MSLRRSAFWVALAILVALTRPAPARATVEMQNAARKLGFEVRNCLHCHATAHAAQVMRQKAREMNLADGNCLLCHGSKIPAKLNERGQWLVDEKARRKAASLDMAWLKDYKPESPAPQKKP